MAKARTLYGCRECGHELARWAGRCPSCGAMNSIVELSRGEAASAAENAVRKRAASALTPEPSTASNASTEQVARLHSGIGELDRVLGGGIRAVRQF